MVNPLQPEQIIAHDNDAPALLHASVSLKMLNYLLLKGNNIQVVIKMKYAHSLPTEHFISRKCD